TNQAVAVPFPGFPAATSGTYNQTFDLTQASTYTGAFISSHGGTAASAEAALLAALDATQTYANIHNATFPGGEIRAQLAPGNFNFSAGIPDGRMGAASRPSGPGVIEIESADDFILTQSTKIK